MSELLLSIKNLKTHFYTDDGIVPAVDGVDFKLLKGETLAIVGESGCGKSVTALSIIGLVPHPPGRIVDGEILFKERNLLTLSEDEMRGVRGNDIAMIFQEPMTSLNPLFTIGRQIQEAIKLHQGLSGRAARGKAVEMLDVVGIPSPEKRIRDYPHQLSGGMRQRVMIAMALSCRPDLLIADEPTTALDVTIQAQILDLIARLKEELGTSVLLITHDMGVVAETADKVLIMYCGKAVEYTDLDTFIESPKHPYSRGLIDSIPQSEGNASQLKSIDGAVPDLLNLPRGCTFSTRCRHTMERCSREEQPFVQLEGGRMVRCRLYDDESRYTDA